MRKVTFLVHMCISSYTYAHFLVYICRNWRNNDPWDKVAETPLNLHIDSFAFLVVLGFELRALCMLGKTFIEELYSAVLYLENSS